MIRLFFHDNREPMEMCWNEGRLENIGGKRDYIYVAFPMMVVCRNYGLDITASCSHIEFDNGKFIWEGGK